jgi:Flp pilus assembly protein TadG
MRRARETHEAREARKERGAAALEFALALPLLMTLVLGLIDFGYLFYLQLVVQNAAREGARAGSLFIDGRSVTEAQRVAQAYLASLNLSTAGVSAQLTGANPTLVDVSIRSPYTPLVGFVPAIAAITTINGRAVMRRTDGP